MLKKTLIGLSDGEITVDNLVHQSYSTMRRYEGIHNALTHTAGPDHETRMINIIHAADQYKSINQSRTKGIPILVKDAITTEQFPVKKQLYSGDISTIPVSPLVKTLEKQGTVVIGKTNIPKDAMDYQTYNSWYKICCNPYDPLRTSGGSSGGSAVAIALQYCDIALGSDFGGSLRQPASFCGIYSLKPTYGAVQTTGHMMINSDGSNNKQLTIGPMTRSLDDLEVAWKLMTEQSMDPHAKEYPDDITSYQILFSSHWDHIETDHGIVELMRSKFEHFKFEEKMSIPLQQEVSSLHQEYYQILADKSRKLEDSELEDLELMVNSSYDDILGDYDAWIAPVVATLPYHHNFKHEPIEINGKLVNYWKANGTYCLPFNVLGLPVITIPLGKVDGLPVGIQIIGKKFKEQQLFSIVRSIEHSLHS